MYASQPPLDREPVLDAVLGAVLGASLVLVAVAARSLSEVAEEVTLTQYRPWSCWPLGALKAS